MVQGSVSVGGRLLSVGSSVLHCFVPLVGMDQVWVDRKGRVGRGVRLLIPGDKAEKRLLLRIPICSESR